MEKNMNIFSVRVPKGKEREFKTFKKILRELRPDQNFNEYVWNLIETDKERLLAYATILKQQGVLKNE